MCCLGGLNILLLLGNFVLTWDVSLIFHFFVRFLYDCHNRPPTLLRLYSSWLGFGEVSG